MGFNPLSRLGDDELVRTIRSLLVRDRKHTAELIAHLAEAVRRKLYLAAGYPAMYFYCVHELGMSEAVAYKRSRAARVVLRFPAVLTAIADGRLHLDAVRLLSKHFRRHNVESLIDAATHRTSREVQLLIAERFPRLDVPTTVRPMLPVVCAMTPRVEAEGDSADVSESSELDAHPVPNMSLNTPTLTNSLRPAEPASSPRLTPTSVGRFALQVTLDQRTHDLLRRAQELLGPAASGHDIAQVLGRALEEFVRTLEHEKFATTDSPRARRSDASGRYVPAEMKREVAERDGYRCAFVGATGRRCSERSDLKIDHIVPIARGGRTTLDNLRLLCAPHNQYEAERIYGEAFMQAKREAAGHVDDLVRERASQYAMRRTKARASCRRGLRVFLTGVGLKRFRPACAAARCRGRGWR